MDILILLIFCLLINNQKNINYDYLSKDNTLSMKGYLAIGIIFHHISQLITTNDIFSNFNYMGTYIVSIFFFLSGYGLVIQFLNKDNYLKTFFSRRILPLTITIFIFSCIYLIYRLYIGQNIKIDYFITLFTKGSTIILNGWFLNIIILMYLFFYLSFKCIKNIKLAIISVIILCLLYIIIAIKLTYGFWWYNTVLTFPLGLIWGYYKQSIDSIYKKFYSSILFSSAISLFLSHKYDKIINLFHINNSYFYTLIANLDNIIFTIFFITLSQKVIFINKFSTHLGKISFEIYLFHGLIISILSPYLISSTLGNVSLTILVVLISIFLSNIYKKLNGKF